MIPTWLALAGLFLGAPDPVAPDTAAPDTATGVTSRTPADERFNDLYTEMSKQPAPDAAAVARLRALYPETSQYDPYGDQGDSLRSAGDLALTRKDWPAVVEACQARLKINPIDIDAHLQCAHAYREMGSAWTSHHKAVITGLLQAIVGNNDGRTLKQAWHVLDVHEANAVLNLLKYRRKSQKFRVFEGSRYDVVEIINPEGSTFRVYFNMDIPWRFMRRRVGKESR